MLPSAVSLLGSAKRTLTADECWSGTGPESPSSRTSESFEQPDSTCSTADSLAKTSAWPGRAPDSMEARAPASGSSLPEPFAYFDRGSSSSRTSPASFDPPPGSSPTDAYAAGLIDGEGCISLCRTKRGTYTLRLDVGMSAPALPLLTALSEHYGGTVALSRRETEKWAAAYRWYVGGQAMVALLKTVRPLLILKRPQADLALRFHAMRSRQPLYSRDGRRGWSDEARAEAAEMAQQMRELNRKGPAPPADARWRPTQAALFESADSASSLVIWPKWGTTLGGDAFELPTLVPLTGASGSSCLLGTPTTSDAKGPSPNHAGTLAEHLALLPTLNLLLTPLAADAANARNSTAGRTKVQPSVEAGTWNGKGLESLSDLAFRGAFTSPPSDDGNTFEATPLPGQLTIGDA